MPVGHQYTSRPYSSFRAQRGSCTIHYGQNTTQNNHNNHSNNNFTTSNTNTTNTTNTYLSQQSQQNLSKSIITTNTSHSNNNGNYLSTSSSSNAINVKNSASNNSNNNSSNVSSNFTRQQPFRSSFYSTRYNHNCNGNHISQQNGHNMTDKRQNNTNTTTTTVKPLTPKLVRRIETACTNANSNTQQQNVTTKPRAPAPPSSAPTTTTTSTSTPLTANKQYLRTRNQHQPPIPPIRNHTNFERFHNTNLSFRQKPTNGITVRKSPAVSCSSDSFESSKHNNGCNYYNNNNRTAGIVQSNVSQKRAYATVTKVAKENQPNTAVTSATNERCIRSIKNYPAPLPPGTPKGATKKKQKDELKLSSISASPNLNNRRYTALTASQRRKQLPHINNSINTDMTAAKNGSTGSNSSAGSSGSHGSPKSKKAFSTKFPQGLPFEDEFYRRYRSYSQSSSSNYSFYSSVGAPNTPHGRDYDNRSIHNGHIDDDDDDDEFQRKPANDEPLYVDFTKVMQRQDYNNKSAHYGNGTTMTIVPTTTWIGAPTSLNNPATPTTKFANESSLNESSYAALTNSAYQQQTYSSNMRTTKSNKQISHSINDYLYTSNGTKLMTTSASTSTSTSTTTKTAIQSTNGDSRKLKITHSNASDEQEDGYYTNGSPEPPPQTDIYLAVASWAPKCSHPTKVHIPPSNGAHIIDDTNNNAHNYNDYYHQRQYHHQQQLQQQQHQQRQRQWNGKPGDILEPTMCEYK
ncbi:myb-like protein I [Teleopsis dalmanni]|uniref:myb-like protein I n=1 Tax=Teleopsis dalmanni TaxID=139649 RepID=UPI0018CF8167|nr:myb-like protein I [Teleopsis dalmanni]